MTYFRFMQSVPITVAETQMFERAAAKIWSEDERLVLVDYMARNPDSGDVIPGTGGLRKLRWGRAGSGKRGGARVIYFYYDVDIPLYLLFAYAKSDAADLSAEGKRIITATAAAIKNQRKRL